MIRAWRRRVVSNVIFVHLEIPGVVLVAGGLRRSCTRTIVLIDRGLL